MIQLLDAYIKDLNGDSWEELCQYCYFLKYEKSYHEIPAMYKGDGGIEGYTDTGIVIQCYYPEKNYDDDKFYEKLRRKMTDDINKLIDEKYKKRLILMGVPTIVEWDFVIPNYKDSRILEHAQEKTNMVVELVLNDTIDKYNYISPEFKVVVLTAKNFMSEIYKITAQNLIDKKVTFENIEYIDVDWTKCDSEKSENIKRKIKAITKSEENVQELLELYANSYLNGIQLMSNLRENYVELYEEIQKLANSYKLKVFQKTKLNPNSSNNYNMFWEIMEDFEKTLSEKFSYIESSSITILQLDLIGMWLADCSLYFK